MKNKGFTLMELAIVMVIIGTLIGSVLIGQSMIRAAELREVIGDYDRYVKAIKQFQDKYQAIPGDMNNAESIWGSDTGCPSTTENIEPKIPTCNGNGNGRIGSSDISGVIDSTQSYEWFRAWQQLSNAGLIEGKFTGARKSPFNTHAGIGLNVPRAKTSELAGWTLYYYLQTTTNNDLWGDNYGHLLVFGGETEKYITQNPTLSTSDSLSIDQKIDDGLPGRGFVRSYRNNVSQPNCTENDTSQDAAIYNAAYTSGAACSLIFILGF